MSELITEVETSTDFSLADLEAALRDPSRVLDVEYKREDEPDPRYSSGPYIYYPLSKDDEGNSIPLGYKNALADLDIDPDAWESEGYDSKAEYLEEYMERNVWDELPDAVQGIGTFKVVEHWNLGDGHECGMLLEHVESGRLFRKTGWYSSWDTGDWDGPLEEVVPANVVVRRYRPIDKPDVDAYEYPAVTLKEAKMLTEEEFKAAIADWTERVWLDEAKENIEKYNQRLKDNPPTANKLSWGYGKPKKYDEAYEKRMGFERFLDRVEYNEIPLSIGLATATESIRENSEIFKIVTITEEDGTQTLFKVATSYDSWNDTDWEYAYIDRVEEFTKTVTDYRPV